MPFGKSLINPEKANKDFSIILILINRKYVNAIERFMHDHNVNRKLKTKIEAYLFHLWQTEKTRDSEME